MATDSQGLEDSWVVNDTDDGDASWADGDSPSDEEDNIAAAKSKRRAHNTRARKATRSHQATSPEPEFIMPSVDASFSGTRRRHNTQRTSPKSTPVKAPRSRTVSTRSTPARQSTSQAYESNRAGEIAMSGLEWVMEIVGYTLTILQKPIAFVLAFYVLLVAVQVGQNFLTNSITRALSPICRIPGVSFFQLALCRPYGEEYPKLSSSGHVPDPEFEALMKVQSQFETIISDTAASASLPMDMKRSEISIRDLRQLVKFSQLPSKHELEHELDGFVETARIASYDLQKFDSHVGRSVDKVLSTNRWTRRVLDDIDLQRSERGWLPGFVRDTVLAPFQPLPFTESRLLDQYIQHSHIVSGEIATLIEEAQALLQVLQNLEDRLDVMYSITTHDKIQIQGSKDEVLRELWSYIGLNKARLGKHDNQLQLLGMVSNYRKAALNHVTRTLVHLQSMGAELEELRERVASPGMMRAAGVKQIPLSVHMENIELGVERLEAGRAKAKEVQDRHVRRVLDQADGHGREDIKHISSS